MKTMNLQDKNWENLFGHITTEGVCWHGIWTMYSPDKEVLNSFKAVRKFQANEEKTLITHTNKYTYSDKTESEKIWQIEKQICSQPDGVIHPALLSTRTLSFGQDQNAVISQKIEPEQKLATELFFRYQDLRTSVVSVYAENGEFLRITTIRERLNTFPNFPPEVDIEKLLLNWSGRKKLLNPNLEISTIKDNQKFVLDPTEGKNHTIFLPDNIVVNVPKIIKIGEEFEIVAGKLLTENEYQRLTVQYNNCGEFSQLFSEVFRLQDEAER